MSLFRRNGNSPARPGVRVLFQAVVSLVLVAVLVIVALRTQVFSTLATLQPGAVAWAAGLYVVACVFNSLRWQLLLRNGGVRERLGRLTALYFIGMFFTLFLPTTVGGDAFRIYEVARRSGRPTETIVATLQERLLNLGTGLLIGLGATLYFLPLIPMPLCVWIVLGQVGAAVVISLLLYPTLLGAAARGTWRALGHRPAMRRLVEHRLVARVLGVLRPVVDSPPPRPSQMVPLLSLAGMPVFLAVGMHYVVGRSLEIQAGFLVYCLVVPVVWVVRMLPVSLNGLGVGEGAFVLLMGMFAVPEGQALALALTMLGLQTGLALAGGVVLAVRLARGTWASVRAPAELGQPFEREESSPPSGADLPGDAGPFPPERVIVATKAEGGI
jgi:uncharacterized membrane protein YbhN (UPF0104 family)